MLHIIPILCLLGFFGFVEYRLQREILAIQKEINDLKEVLKK